ncbi:hypothetical protein PROFUN_07334 [Planoprotostelium fungivorum]|uniref:TOG domain-containing protein n=1 Tax=Planoprotostelium fungivorum TaxID=1890364 RepID=A0A2P6NLY6_9EUKA|nr:hypothetical protein PROFUN_07334 [Planoprotostelium fungivorum]
MTSPSEEQSDYWTDIQEGLYSSSLNKRSVALNNLLTQSQENQWTKEDLIHATDLIFSTLIAYDDSKSAQKIEETIKKLGARPDFASTFLSQWTKTCAELFKRSNVSPLSRTPVRLFRWSCQLFLGFPSTLHPVTENTAAFSSVVSNQSLLLSAIANHPRSKPLAVRTCSHLFRDVLKKHPTLYDKYYNALIGMGELHSNNGLLVTPVLQHALETKKMEGKRGQFVDWYVKIVLLATSAPSSSVNRSFLPLVKSLTSEEITSKVISSLSRVLKRTPELVLTSVGYLVAHSTADIDQVMEKELLPIVLSCLKTTNDSTKEATLELVRQMSKRATQVSVLQVMAQHIVKMYKEKLSLQEKTTVAAALNRMSETTQESASTIAPIVSAGLLDQVEVENNDDARAVEMQCLSKWLHVLPSYSDKAVKVIQQGVSSDKESVKIGALDCIRNSLGGSSSEKSQKVLTLLPNILKIVKASKGTADGTLALLVLSDLAQLETAADTSAKNEKVWLSAFKSEAPLLKPMLIAKLKDGEVVHLAHFLCAVLARNITAEGSEDTKNVSTTLLRLALHSSHSVRQSVRRSINDIHTKNTSATSTLLDAFSTVAKDDGKPEPKELRYLLLSCVHPSIQVQKVPLAILLVSRPDVSGTEKRTTVEALRQLLKKCNIGEQWFRENSVKVSEYIRDECLNSDEEKTITSALQAARSVSAVSPITIPTFTSWLNPFFYDLAQRLKSFSKYRMGVYQTEEGQVYDKEDMEAAIKKENAAAKNAAAKKKQDVKPVPKKGPIETIEDRIKREFLASESAIRQEVRQTVLQGNNRLRLVQYLSHGNPAEFRASLGRTLFSVLPLLNTLCHEQAAKTVLALSTCSDRSLSHVSTYLGHALVAMEMSKETPFVEAILEKCVKYIVDASRGGSLSPPTFYYVFPLLDASFNRCVLSMNGQEGAMSLLERHTQADVDYPRGRMCSTLIKVLSSFPRFQQRAREALIATAGSLLTAAPKDEFEEKDLVYLLRGIISEQNFVRSSTLQALEAVPAILDSALPARDDFTSHLWIATHDSEEENAFHARNVFDLYGHTVPQTYSNLLTPFVVEAAEAMPDGEKDTVLQTMVAQSIVDAIKLYPDTLGATLEDFFTLYKSNVPAEGVNDDLMKSNVRYGAATVLSASGAVLDEKNMRILFDFLLKAGLFDEDDAVRRRMIQVGLDVINQQGQAASGLLPLFEEFFSKPSTDMASDRVREASVIFLGTVARHLEANNPKVEVITDRLMETLSTPSESVQRAVSTCLIPLFATPSLQAKAETYIDRLIGQLKSNAVSFAERRGAAYGLAGVVKGLGIPSLKKFEVVTKLQSMVEDKKHPAARQGSLFAFETLTTTLQRLFEPYIIQTLPKLLNCFGDTSNDVRLAVVDTSRVVMAQLSAHGVKLVLPALLKALDDKSNWKTKKGAIELLGSMAFCSPKQLSSCLPMIVPKLSIVLTDTHNQVQEAAEEALKHIGSVIRNSEIQMHVPILLKAITDPDLYTRDALEALIHTNFVHSIDAASLSLIAPILHRGNTDRSIETKKKAAQIVGNMCSLAETKDLEPYLDVMISDLKSIITDPIPEVRAISSKALGSLIQGMGEDKFSGLIPWLLDNMKSDVGSVERSGAAQGLSEVLAALDISRFETLLPEILSNSNHTKPYVREGSIGLFVFLPATFTGPFQEYLDQVLPCILKGLSDETESVRDISLRAGQSIVNQYALSSLELLLPAMEQGIFDDSWRIRQSSVQLLGDLMYHVITKSANPDADPCVTLDRCIGFDKRNKILAALYMIRNDVSSVVRQKALLVWKSVVQNTPKALKDLLIDLMRIIIDCLGSANLDKRQVSGKTLGDLVQKLGDNILPEIIPILEKGLDSPDPDQRQGVCIGLTEVMSSANRTYLASYSPVLIPAVRRALCDELEDVREAAAQAFDTLYRFVGQKALDEILPPLLDSLQDEGSNALDGLRQILAVKSSVVLPFLVPKLLKPPITTFNVKALASIAQVSGSALNQHLAALVPTLLGAIAASGEEADSVATAAETIVLAVGPDGYQVLFYELIQQMREPISTSHAAAAAKLIGSYCEKTEVDFEPELPNLMRCLMIRLMDDSPLVQQAALTSLGQVLEATKKDNVANYIPELRNILDKLKEDLEKKNRTMLPGFNLPKGMAPVLPMLLQGLKVGSAELREQAALGLGEVLNMTSDAAAKPFLIQITGPLIRIIVDRFPWQVKAAILQTLNLIMVKGGVNLKPFIPQLQTTFIKALQDPTKAVRIEAAEALGRLVTLGPKVEPLILELLNMLSTGESSTLETVLIALQRVLLHSTNISQEVMNKVGNSLISLLQSDEENIRAFAAKSLGAFSKTVPAERLTEITSSLLKEGGGWTTRHSHSLALKSILYHTPNAYDGLEKPFLTTLTKWAADEKLSVRQSVCETVGRIVLLGQITDAALGQYLNILAQMINDTVSDIKITALKNVKKFAKRCPQVSRSYLNVLVPPTMAAVKDRMNVPVKLAAERALMHLLQVHHTPATLDEYAATLDNIQAKNIADYSKRILSKLVPDSDDSDTE